MRVDAPRSALAVATAAVLALAGCGSAGSSGDPAASSSTKQGSAAAKVAKDAPKPAATANGVVLTRDPEEDQSFPLPAGTRGAKEAPLPSAAPAAQRRKASKGAASEISPGAPSDAEIRRELKQMEQAIKDFKRGSSGAGTAAVRAALTDGGHAQTPTGAPDVIGRIIAGSNAIAKFPYVWGGGHGSFVDSGYDCSGSVSYALAAAGLLDSPLVSGDFAKWGAPGPGKWVTIYANGGHVFMYVAGLRFDTSGRDGPFGSRWQTAPRSLAGFTVRHPTGL
jgi:cell wall-associated NlpC family hydrolase